MNILVTRASGSEASLVTALEKLGNKVWYCPVIKIVPLDDNSDASIVISNQKLVEQINVYDSVIAVSGNAAKYGLPYIHQTCSQLPRHLAWYAIGASTAKVLNEYGLDAKFSQQSMNSEALLAAHFCCDLKGKKVLILRGVGGREFLAEELRDRGAIVDYIELYRRICPNSQQEALNAIWRGHSIDVSIVSSGEGLDNLCALTNRVNVRSLTSTVLIVPSHRVGAMARKLGFINVVISENAGDGAVVAAVKQLIVQ